MTWAALWKLGLTQAIFKGILPILHSNTLRDTNTHLIHIQYCETRPPFRLITLSLNNLSRLLLTSSGFLWPLYALEMQPPRPLWLLHWAQLVSQCIQLFLQEYSGAQYMLCSIDNICGIMMMTTKKLFRLVPHFIIKEEEKSTNMARVQYGTSNKSDLNQSFYKSTYSMGVVTLKFIQWHFHASSQTETVLSGIPCEGREKLNISPHWYCIEFKFVRLWTFELWPI